MKYTGDTITGFTTLAVTQAPPGFASELTYGEGGASKLSAAQGVDIRILWDPPSSDDSFTTDDGKYSFGPVAAPGAKYHIQGGSFFGAVGDGTTTTFVSSGKNITMVNFGKGSIWGGDGGKPGPFMPKVELGVTFAKGVYGRLISEGASLLCDSAAFTYIKATTGNHDIILRDCACSGKTRVYTANGEIILEGQYNDVVMEANNGKMRFEGSAASLYTKASNGKTLVKGSIADLVMSSVNGSIDANGTGVYSVRTVNGRMSVRGFTQE